MATLKTPVTSEDHIQGSDSAPALLVEYGDYECPYCGQAYPIIKRLQKHFRNQLCLVFRNFPLGEMHPHAQGAAESAEFAGAYGRFWEMHDRLFENQQRLGEPLYSELARELKLSPESLQEALADGTYRARVRADFSSGARSGVNGTPTFFINGKRHDGPWDYADLVLAIERAIGEQQTAISA